MLGQSVDSVRSLLRHHLSNDSTVQIVIARPSASSAEVRFGYSLILVKRKATKLIQLHSGSWRKP